MSRTIRWLALGVLLGLLFVLGVAQAHEGHVHEADAVAEPAPVLALPSSDRVALSSSRIELVAVRAADGSLRIDADEYVSNMPLTEVALTVVLGSRNLQAAAIGPGSWQLPAAVLDQPGQPLLHYEFRGDGWSDSLQAALPLTPAAPTSPGAGDGSGLVLVLLPLLPLLAAAALLRRRVPGQD